MDFPVTQLPATDHPEPGERAPSFTRPLVDAEGWRDRSLAGLLETDPVVLVFHPMDGAFPALYTWKEVAGRDWTAAATVVGVSPSTPYEHAAFVRERGLEGYALFSDPGATVAERYGAAHDLDGMAGVTDARPAVFVVDTDRTVTYAWVAAEYPEFAPYDAVEEAVHDL